MKTLVVLLSVLLSQLSLAAEPTTVKPQISLEERLEQLHADVALISKKLRLLQTLFVTQRCLIQPQRNQMPFQYPTVPRFAIQGCPRRHLMPFQYPPITRFSGDTWHHHESMIDDWFMQNLIGWAGPSGGVSGSGYVDCMAKCRRDNCSGKTGTGLCEAWFHCNEDCHNKCN